VNGKTHLRISHESSSLKAHSVESQAADAGQTPADEADLELKKTKWL